MSGGDSSRRLVAFEPVGFRLEDPEPNSSFAAAGPRESSQEEANANDLASVEGGRSDSRETSLEDQETHISATNRDPPSVEENRATLPRPNVPWSGPKVPVLVLSKPSDGAAPSCAPVPPPELAAKTSLPSYKQQCLVEPDPAGNGEPPTGNGAPILVRANPVSDSQLLAEQERQQMDPSEAEKARRRRKVICCGIYGLLVLAVVITLAGICGDGNCRPSQALPSADTLRRGLPLTPSPGTLAPSMAPVTITLAPSMAPVTLTRESRLANLINDMTLLAGRIGYPLPTNPSPEEEALSWLIEDDPARLPASRKTQVIQRFVLAVLWFNNVIPQTPDYTASWLVADDECEWEGLLCSSGVATSLRISENTAAGRLPSDIGLLTALTRLAIFNNSLVGTIPSSVSRLTDLAILTFGTNDLTGVIPSSIALLTQLTLLTLHENTLRGEIPDFSALTLLELIALHANGLEGTVPPSIASLTRLTYLDFHDNVLTGTIPDLGSLSGLNQLSLGENLMTGSIPAGIGSMTALTRLLLDDMNLSGSIPSEISSLSHLLVVSLDENLLTGTIPDLSTTNLTAFASFNNGLTGSIPRVDSLTALLLLDVRKNGLTGTLPEFASPLMEIIWLSENKLVGTLPSSYGSMSKLKQLAVNNNNISSSIPGTFSGMISLTQLTLSGNPITGTIPIELKSLPALTAIHLFNTDLTGPVPFCNSTEFAIETLAADCYEIECPCCTRCCPRGGLNGIPGWDPSDPILACDM